MASSQSSLHVAVGPDTRWHQSVSPGTYPSWQRGFASSAARSARTKGATLVLARLGNATASLNLSVSPTRLRRYCCAVRRDARHTAARSAETKGTAQLPCGSGETQGEGVSLHFSLTNLSGLTTRICTKMAHSAHVDSHVTERAKNASGNELFTTGCTSPSLVLV